MLRLSLETIALWVELPDRFTDLVEKHNLDFPGGIHAIEHAMIAMYPLRLLADKNDVGGVSTPGNNDLDGNCGIFVYDGFAFKLFFFLFPDILFKHFTFFPDR
jgi:DEAD/DEAH box helicase domain-containing protein